jgi:mxaK protein
MSAAVMHRTRWFQPGTFRSACRRLWHGFLAARTFALILLTLGGAGGIAASAWIILQTDRDNSVIRQLAAGKDIEVDPAAAPARLLAARQYFLLQFDRIGDAQIFTDAAASRGDPHSQARLHYNLGSARVRQAFSLIEKGDLDKAVSIVGLAKNNLRQALRLEPGLWDAKHNLYVAQRLVRDLPRGEGGEEETPSEKAKPLWTDLPGQPRGLP